MRHKSPKTRRDLFRHTKRRFFERFGIDLEEHEYKSLGAQIHVGSRTIGQAITNRLSLHRVTLRGKEYRVLYDKTRKSVATVFTDDMDPLWGRLEFDDDL